jgi:hypothetical protein
MTTKPPLQKILQGILHTKMKANKTMREQAVSNHRRRKDKESENNIDSTTYNQTLKQQRQLNDRNLHILININTECQWIQLPHQESPFTIIKNGWWNGSRCRP